MVPVDWPGLWTEVGIGLLGILLALLITMWKGRP